MKPLLIRWCGRRPDGSTGRPRTFSGHCRGCGSVAAVARLAPPNHLSLCRPGPKGQLREHPPANHRDDSDDRCGSPAVRGVRKDHEQATPPVPVQTRSAPAPRPSGGAAPVASADPSRDAGPSSGGGRRSHHRTPDWLPDRRSPSSRGSQPRRHPVRTFHHLHRAGTDLRGRLNRTAEPNPFGAVQPEIPNPAGVAGHAAQQARRVGRAVRHHKHADTGRR